MNKTQTIYLDGTYRAADEAFTRSLTPGYMTGKGVFETFRVYQSTTPTLFLHLKRLHKGLACLGLSSPLRQSHIEHIMRGLLKKNNLKDAHARVVVWEHKQKRHTAIIVQPLSKVTRQLQRRGCRAMVSVIVRNRTKTSHIKSIHYRLSKEALEAARKKGFDEAILMNSKGHVVEGTRMNIFVVKQNILTTPPLSSGCLEGVTRAMVLSLALRKGYQTHERPVTLAQLRGADEVFLTNALVGITPLHVLNKRTFHQGRIGPVTADLRKAYGRMIQSVTRFVL